MPPAGSHCSSFVFAVLASSAVGLAQTAEPPRATFARVLDADGSPVVRAVVTFAGHVPQLGALGPTDEVVVESDERGRATAKLQPGLCYVAWAVGPADAEGRSICSTPTAYFSAGALFELRCTGSILARRLAVTGTEAWAAEGLRFFAVSPSPGTEIGLELRDGAIEVPPMPRATIEVRTADGRPLWSTPLPEGSIDVPPPQRVRIRVVDENGQPVPDATVRQRVALLRSWRMDGPGTASIERIRDLGRVDGEAELLVCHDADPVREGGRGDMFLLVQAKGRAAVGGGVFKSWFVVDDQRQKQSPGDVLVFRCPRQEPLTGNCGGAFAGGTAHLWVVAKITTAANSFAHDPRSFSVPIGADGSFVFDSVPADVHSMRLAIVPCEGGPAAPLFPTMHGRTLPAEVVPIPGARPAPIEVSEFRVRLLEPDGDPGRGAVVSLIPLAATEAGIFLRDAAVRFPVDTRGEARVRVVGRQWAIVAVTSTGCGARYLDPDSAGASVELRLDPLASMSVRLTDANGDPIAGASPYLRGSAGSPTDPLGRAFADSTGLRETWNAMRTDRDGRLRIPFLPFEGQSLRVLLQWPSGRTADFELVNGNSIDLRPK
ncbi:MAG: hypothetical protein JNK78_00570 [Planctomycetes bacterium]|nr:hypothetical protein [Planctomycetota bacterium]